MKPPGKSDTRLYAQILENLEDAVAAINPGGRIIFFNPAAQEHFGLSERQSVGRAYADLFAGQEKLLYLIDSAVRSGRSISDHENIFLHRPGAPSLPVSVSASPIFSAEGERDGVVLILRDLSRVRELEEAVRRADRLSMLGTLAAGLAHEIKNPLGGIKGAAQLLDLDYR